MVAVQEKEKKIEPQMTDYEKFEALTKRVLKVSKDDLKEVRGTEEPPPAEER